jgi:hypothetical protein
MPASSVPETSLTDGRELADELTAARSTFMTRIDELIAARGRDARLSGDWSPRELIAHLGYWVGHAADAIHAVEQGRAEEFEFGEREVDARNETVARIARQTDLGTVRRREEGSYRALLELLHALDPTQLDKRLAGRDSLRQGIRENGPAHYLDHAAELGAEE